MELNNNEIEKLFNQDEDQLFYDLGFSLSQTGLFPKDKEKLIEFGKKWLNLNLDKIRGHICPNKKLQKLFSESNDNIELISGLADFLSSIFTDIAPVTLSVILVKYGYNNLCENQKTD